MPNQSSEVPLLVFVISSKDIKQRNIKASLGVLRKLSESRAVAYTWREKLILSVHGYDDDPRGLAEIPSVREHFTAITAAWPYWLWFMVRKHEQIGLVQSLLTEIRAITRHEGHVALDFEEHSQEQVWRKLCSGMKNGLGALGVDPDDIEASIGSAIDELTSAMVQVDANA